jgi:hypothetical protein
MGLVVPKPCPCTRRVPSLYQAMMSSVLCVCKCLVVIVMLQVHHLHHLLVEAVDQVEVVVPWVVLELVWVEEEEHQVDLAHATQEQSQSHFTLTGLELIDKLCVHHHSLQHAHPNPQIVELLALTEILDQPPFSKVL